MYVNNGEIRDYQWLLENKVGLHGKIHIAKYGFTYRGEKVRSSLSFVTLESVVNKTHLTGSHPGAYLEPSRTSTMELFAKINPSMFDWVLNMLLTCTHPEILDISKFSLSTLTGPFTQFTHSLHTFYRLHTYSV